jgi:hypothetical protein
MLIETLLYRDRIRFAKRIMDKDGAKAAMRLSGNVRRAFLTPRHRAKDPDAPRAVTAARAWISALCCQRNLSSGLGMGRLVTGNDPECIVKPIRVV